MLREPSSRRQPQYCIKFLPVDAIAAIPHIARFFFREVSTPPKWCDNPYLYLVSHRHICAIPHFATYRAIIVRYPTKTITRDFCDTIAAGIARYEKYRCWASKVLGCSSLRLNGDIAQPLPAPALDKNRSPITCARKQQLPSW